jgi:hypothetical protein
MGPYSVVGEGTIEWLLEEVENEAVVQFWILVAVDVATVTPLVFHIVR